MGEEAAAIRCVLDDGSLISLAWLGNGSLSLQRFKSGNARDGHGFLLTASGVIDASTVAVFLAASEPPPPRAA